MAFQFSLAAVLRVRATVEEREERVLQKILFELMQTREELLRNFEQIKRSDIVRNEDILMPSIGHRLHALYGAVQQHKQRRKELEEKIQQLEQLRDQQVSVYEAARRDREILTDLEKEKRSAYELDRARREQKILDDNYLARLARG